MSDWELTDTPAYGYYDNSLVLYSVHLAEWKQYVRL